LYFELVVNVKLLAFSGQKILVEKFTFYLKESQLKIPFLL